MNVRTDTDVVDGRPVWTTRLRLRTAGRLNDLYSVDDRLVGYWHTGRHRSLGYDYHENHGGDRESEIVRYHHEEGFYTENGQRAGPLRPGTLDLASALFAMRSRTIRPGQRQEWTIQVTGDTYHVLSRVDAVEVVRVPGLTVRAHRVRLRPKDPEAYRTMKSWLEEDAEGLYIWFSTDPLQIPLRVRAATMIGTVEAVLTEYDRADDA